MFNNFHLNTPISQYIINNYPYLHIFLLYLDIRKITHSMDSNEHLSDDANESSNQSFELIH